MMMVVVGNRINPVHRKGKREKDSTGGWSQGLPLSFAQLDSWSECLGDSQPGMHQARRRGVGGHCRDPDRPLTDPRSPESWNDWNELERTFRPFALKKRYRFLG
jgi:hypothetical protein